MPREVFIAGQILTAAEMNSVSDQTVMVFAGTAARGSAIPSPVEGMTTYLEDSNILSIYDGSAWKTSLGVTGGILQVVSTTKTDTFTTTSASVVDITGLSVSITPSSTASKVLVFFNVNVSNSTDNAQATMVNLYRNSTAILAGTGGSVSNSSGMFYGSSNQILTLSGTELDSPNTTSATTYKLGMFTSDGSTGTVNRRGSGTTRNVASSITVMEVAG